jgi:hypothetical protein
VTHANWACQPAALEAGSGQGRTTATARRATNGVTFPSFRRYETARTFSFGRNFGGTASSTGRVFGNFAAFRLSASRLAVGQACTPAFDVGPHADWANILAANKFGSGQVLNTATARATDDVTFPGRRCREAAGTASFGRIFGGTASSTGREFGNFAAFGPFAGILASVKG